MKKQNYTADTCRARLDYALDTHFAHIDLMGFFIPINTIKPIQNKGLWYN